MAKRSIEAFYTAYERAPDGESFAPYRVTLLGALSTGQKGVVHMLGVDRGVHIAYARREDCVLEFRSIGAGKTVRFSLKGRGDRRNAGAGNSLRDVALALKVRFDLENGLNAVMERDLSGYGMGAETATMVAFAKALCAVNGIAFNEDVFSALTSDVNDAEWMSVTHVRKDELFVCDLLDGNARTISSQRDMLPFSIMLFESGLEKERVRSGYALREDECTAAAYALEACAGLPYGRLSEASLRNVPREIFDAYGNRLPDFFRRRAKHFYTELERTALGARLWEAGDIAGYGQLMLDSGHSSIVNYECGCHELITLCELLKGMNGVYGARFLGAGFKGSCMALVEPERAEEIASKVRVEYVGRYPKLETRFQVYHCRTADGVGIQEA